MHKRLAVVRLGQSLTPRHEYAIVRERVAIGTQFIHFLKSHDPEFPLPSQSLFSDYKEFLSAYQAYLGDRGLRDPVWGLDPREGLMTAKESVEHCAFELRQRVGEYERRLIELEKLVPPIERLQAHEKSWWQRWLLGTR